MKSSLNQGQKSKMVKSNNNSQSCLWYLIIYSYIYKKEYAVI